MQTEINAPRIFLPDEVLIVTQHEFHQLQELTPPTLQALESLNSRLATPLHSLDLDPLLLMHQTLRQPQTEIRWHKIVIILISVIL